MHAIDGSRPILNSIFYNQMNYRTLPETSKASLECQQAKWKFVLDSFAENAPISKIDRLSHTQAAPRPIYNSVWRYATLAILQIEGKQQIRNFIPGIF